MEQVFSTLFSPSPLTASVMIDKVPLERSLGGPVDGVGFGIGIVDGSGVGGSDEGCGGDALGFYHTNTL